MNLLLTPVLRRIMNLAEGRGAGLLVHGHHFPTKQCVDERGLARVEITGDKHLRRSILDTGP